MAVEDENLLECASPSFELWVTIIDFRKVGGKGLKNEDKVGQKSLGKRQSRTKKFEKEDKVGQKSLKKRTR